MGFVSIAADSCIFIRFDKDGIVIIDLYVNNILIVTKTEAIMKAIKKGIHEAFKCTKTKFINRILGIQVHRDWKIRTVILEQL